MAQPDEPQTEPPEPTTLSRGYARGRERDEQIRAGLVPLAPGERPPALVVAATIAVALGAANIALFAAGVEIDGNTPGAVGVGVFAVLMFGLAAGMLRGAYWFVLAFQALLGITVIVAALSLMVASNGLALLLCVGIVGLGGWLFWKLVRVMARMQAPLRELDS